jgi:hypothetical protein
MLPKLATNHQIMSLLYPGMVSGPREKGLEMQPSPGSDFIRFLLCVLPIVLFGLASAPQVLAEEPGAPEIIAQGFDMAVPQEGQPGKFGRLRVRIEAPEQISTLYIRERSYEVDLATTLDQVNYQLFGIEKRVRRYKDVTLDFGNYINEKISAPGNYEISIQVKDDEGGTATARLAIIVTAEAADEKQQTDADAVPMRTGSFRFERAGPGRVEGAADFGITWKTIHEIGVVIRINVSKQGYSMTDGLVAAQYEEILDAADLDSRREADTQSGFATYIEMPTAFNAAAESVLAIDTPDQYCVMKVNRSETSLSDIGTTVVLQGEYKCSEK